LAVIGPDAREALPRIGDFLQDKDTAMRVLAAEALAEMGPVARPAIPLLVKALRDPEPTVRLAAAEALHEISLATVNEVLPLARDRDANLRLSAVQALVLFHECQEAVEALVEALRDRDVRVRASAAASLTRLGPAGKAALPGLLECLEESDLELQSQAFTAILAIAVPPTPKLLDDLTELNGKDGVGWAFARLTAAKRKEEIARITAALDDANPTRRLGAVLALGQLGPDAKEAVPRLSKAFARETSRAVLAAMQLVLPALDPKQKVQGKTGEMFIAEMWRDLKAAKKMDVEELIQLYVLTATLGHGRFQGGKGDAKLKETAGKARAWAMQAVDDLPYSPWALPALVRGINITAEFNMGFTEPFGRLSFKLQAMVKESKEIQPLGYALGQLGQGIQRGSPFWATMERMRYQVFSNTTFIDWIVKVKQQEAGKQKGKMDALVAGQISSMLARLQRGDLFKCHPLQSMAKARESMGASVAKEDIELQLLTGLRAQSLFTQSADDITRKMSGESDSGLIAKFQDQDPWVRWGAVTLVGRRHLPAAKELIELLGDPVAEVRQAARWALVRLARGTDFGPYPSDSPAKTQQSIRRWTTWLQAQEAVPPPAVKRGPE
jgi:HEAT repeat protein